MTTHEKKEIIMSKKIDTVKGMTAGVVIGAIASLALTGVIIATAFIIPWDKYTEKDGRHTSGAPVEMKLRTESELDDNEDTGTARAIFMTDEGEVIREIEVVMVFRHSEGGYFLMDEEGNLTKTDVSERVQIIAPEGFVIG